MAGHRWRERERGHEDDDTNIEEDRAGKVEDDRE